MLTLFFQITNIVFSSALENKRRRKTKGEGKRRGGKE